MRSGWSTTVRPWKAVREQSGPGQWHRSWGSAWKPCGSGATDTVRPMRTPTRRSRSSRRIADSAVNLPSHAERTRSSEQPQRFHRGNRPPHDEMIAFIDKYRDQFSGRGHLPGTPDGRLWVSHLTRLSSRQSSADQNSSGARCDADRGHASDSRRELQRVRIPPNAPQKHSQSEPSGEPGTVG